jgi:hypothetical protein
MCFEKRQDTESILDNRDDYNTMELQSSIRITEESGVANNICRTESFNHIGQKEVFRAIPLQNDDISENGGIANIILELERKERSLKPFDAQKRRSESPPLKEIYIPVNYDAALGSFDLTASSSFNSKRNHRVQSKRDNDKRIQSIMKRGREKFFNRVGRKG